MRNIAKLVLPALVLALALAAGTAAGAGMAPAPRAHIDETDRRPTWT